jgi:hypothetical protein
VTTLRVLRAAERETMPRMRLALPRPGSRSRPGLLDLLLGPFSRMVAWAEPWDIEADEEDAA